MVTGQNSGRFPKESKALLCTWLGRSDGFPFLVANTRGSPMSIWVTRQRRLASTVAAITKASGVGVNQAKAAAYYAAATFLEADPMLTLVILGKADTGESSLMEQLPKLENKPRSLNAKSVAPPEKNYPELIPSLPLSRRGIRWVRA